jgi:Zn-dependent protease with chaperone function/type II secretory pathway pseudopilin PulG
LNQLEYPRERGLAALTLVIGIVFWLGIVVGTVGAALIGLLVGFVAYLFAQSALIAWIKGNGVLLDPRQFPQLHAQYIACCDRLQMKTRPKAYVLNGNGALNAFATRFLGHDYVVLLSDTVDAMKDHPDGASFYIGHELGHLRMNHLGKQLLRWPALWLPLLGAAYARAKESTCDRHGLACSSSPENAALALSALAAGGRNWRQLDTNAFVEQARASKGFWMSFHELCSGYPWLTKRVARVAKGEKSIPSRHPLSWLLAIFVPYAGRLGAGFGIVIMIYIVGVLAAVALPAYKTYVTKAKVSQSLLLAAPARTALTEYYAEKHEVPTLVDLGIAERLSDGSTLALDRESMSLTIATRQGNLYLMPRADDKGNIVRWDCAHGAPLKAADVPQQCAQERDE